MGGTAPLLALELRGVVVHPVPHTPWTVTPVSVELMVILSVPAMSVAQLLPLLPPQLLLLPLLLHPQQPPQPPPPPLPPPAPQCQALLQEQPVSSPSPSQAPPTCPAQSGSTG